MLRRLISTQNDAAVTLLRLVLGVVFFAHGAQKALGWFGGYGFSATISSFTEKMHIPMVFALLAVAAEFLGGIGLLVGLLTRVAAFGIAVNMAVAIATLHYRFGFFANWTGTQRGEGIEFHILVLGITVFLMVKGAGALSVDRLMSRGGNRVA